MALDNSNFSSKCMKICDDLSNVIRIHDYYIEYSADGPKDFNTDIKGIVCRNVRNFMRILADLTFN